MNMQVYEILDTLHRIKRIRKALEDPNVTVDRTGLEEEILELLDDYENVIKEFKVVV